MLEYIWTMTCALKTLSEPRSLLVPGLACCEIRQKEPWKREGWGGMDGGREERRRRREERRFCTHRGNDGFYLVSVC